MGKQTTSAGASGAASSLTARVQTLRSASAKEKVLEGAHDVYTQYLAIADLQQVRGHLRELDAAQYLDAVLWPHVADALATTPDAPDALREQQKALVLSILMLVNAKFRASRGKEWAFVGDESQAWDAFVAALLALQHGALALEWSVLERSHLVQFLIHCYQSLDVPAVAKSFLKLASLPMWSALSPTQRELEFQSHPKLARHWQSLSASDDGDASTATEAQQPAKRRKTSAKPQAPAHAHHAKDFLPSLFRDVLTRLNAPIAAKHNGPDVDATLRYTALVLALVTDLLSQLPTRRFLHAVLRRTHFAMAVRTSPFVAHCLQWRPPREIAALETQLALLDAAMDFAIDAHSGESLSVREQHERASKHIQALQHVAFTDFRHSPLEELAIVPVSAIADATSFASLLAPLVNAQRSDVEALAVTLGVVPSRDAASALSPDALVAHFVDEYARAKAPATWTETPACPTELEIWSDALRSDTSAVYGADDTQLLPVLPIRKLGLQSLDVADFLERAHALVRLDAAAAIRASLETPIRELNAAQSLASPTAETIFRGFSRMATPLRAPVKITDVAKPLLGKRAPASVTAQLELELDARHDTRAFDASFQPNEVVFLVTLRATIDEAAEAMGFADSADEGSSQPFPEQFGVLFVRGAEVVGVADAHGSALTDESPVGKGRKRMLTLALDSAQYQRDVDAGRTDAYTHANVLVRRPARENTFKAVLDALVAASASADELLPAWLHDLFLGYGDPAAATAAVILKQRKQREVRLPLFDLVADAKHAIETCLASEGSKSQLVDAADGETPLDVKDATGPFTLVKTLEQSQSGGVVIEAHRRAAAEAAAPSAAPRFTQSQVAAVCAGMGEGLTVITAPSPGSSDRTAVAVQLVLNLYRATPAREKILVVAPSNQALDALVRELLARKQLNEAEVVRLGSHQRTAAAGSKDGSSPASDAATAGDFSRRGRVDFVLQRRLDLLQEVEFLAKWLEQTDATQYAGLSASAAYSCENALFFYQLHVQPLLSAARRDAASETKAVSEIALSAYFAARNGAAPASREQLAALIDTVDAYFSELQRLQPFELLPTPRQRGDLYMMQHARVVAMTCTHAALNQHKLRALGLTFGSLIVEDAARVSEVDALMALVLASPVSSSLTALSSTQPEARLKRVVLLGDTKGGAAPVVKVPALKTYAHLDQSLFARLLRLDVPHIALEDTATRSSKSNK